jgi:hypothetical protein
MPIAHAQRYVERELMIPWGMAFPNGLHAMLVYADLPGKHPLVVMTHGTSRKPVIAEVPRMDTQGSSSVSRKPLALSRVAI